MARILIIEDDAVFVTLMSRALTQAGHDVVVARDGVEGVAAFEEKPFDAVVTDLVMPNSDGIETIRSIRALRADVAIVAVSGGVSHPAGLNVNYLTAAERLGADATLQKPFMPSVLCNLVNDVLAAKARAAQSRSA
jgi:CheY-like chemotaxis protein